MKKINSIKLMLVTVFIASISCLNAKIPVKVINGTSYNIDWAELDFGGWCPAQPTSSAVAPGASVEFYIYSCCPRMLNVDIGSHRLKYNGFWKRGYCADMVITITEEKDTVKKLKRLKAAEGNGLEVGYSDWIAM